MLRLLVMMLHGMKILIHWLYKYLILLRQVIEPSRVCGVGLTFFVGQAHFTFTTSCFCRVALVLINYWNKGSASVHPVYINNTCRSLFLLCVGVNIDIYMDMDILYISHLTKPSLTVIIQKCWSNLVFKPGFQWFVSGLKKPTSIFKVSIQFKKGWFFKHELLSFYY